MNWPSRRFVVARTIGVGTVKQGDTQLQGLTGWPEMRHRRRRRKTPLMPMQPRPSAEIGVCLCPNGMVFCVAPLVCCCVPLLNGSCRRPPDLMAIDVAGQFAREEQRVSNPLPNDLRGEAAMATSRLSRPPNPCSAMVITMGPGLYADANALFEVFQCGGSSQAQYPMLAGDRCQRGSRPGRQWSSCVHNCATSGFEHGLDLAFTRTRTRP
jgi:hypothetical protein